MKDNIILVAVPGAAVVIILLLKDRISDALWRRRNPPEKLAAERRTRLLQTDWDFYERHLQRPAPAALRDLYSDMALITACGLHYGKRRGISSFEPLNRDHLFDTRNEIGYDIVPFATSGCGDPIYLRPGADQSDIVYIVYHDDPGNVEVFAESVVVLVERLRNENRAA
jgi:hypothetical protein